MCMRSVCGSNTCNAYEVVPVATQGSSVRAFEGCCQHLTCSILHGALVGPGRRNVPVRCEDYLHNNPAFIPFPAKSIFCAHPIARLSMSWRALHAVTCRQDSPCHASHRRWDELWAHCRCPASNLGRMKWMRCPENLPVHKHLNTGMGPCCLLRSSVPRASAVPTELRTDLKLLPIRVP
jgi:hypothetical protein